MPRCVRLYQGMALCLVLSLGILCGRQAMPGWDGWAYHVPFAGELWNPDGFRHKFEWDTLYAARFEGFPRLGEWLGGLFWKLTGKVAAFAAVNFLSLGMFVWFCFRHLNLCPGLLIPSLLAVPLIFFHLQIAYVDLLAGTAVALVCLSTGLWTRSEGTRSTELALWGAAALGVAAGTKFVPGAFASLVVMGNLLLCLLLRYRKIPRREVVLWLTGLALAALPAAKNTLLHGNPVYPVALGPLKGLEGPYHQPLRYLEPLGPLKGAAAVVLSVSEWDWKIRGVTPRYSYDMNTGEVTENAHAPARTGGFWGPYLGLIALLGVLLWWYRGSALPQLQAPTGVLLAATGLWCAFPQPHELRYYLFFPLCLIALTLAGLSQVLRQDQKLVLYPCTWLALLISFKGNTGLIFGEEGSLVSHLTEPPRRVELEKQIETARTEGHAQFVVPFDVRHTTAELALRFGRKGFKLVQPPVFPLLGDPVQQPPAPGTIDAKESITF